VTIHISRYHPVGSWMFSTIFLSQLSCHFFNCFPRRSVHRHQFDSDPPIPFPIPIPRRPRQFSCHNFLDCVAMTSPVIVCNPSSIPIHHPDSQPQLRLPLPYPAFIISLTIVLSFLFTFRALHYSTHIPARLPSLLRLACCPPIVFFAFLCPPLGYTFAFATSH
jgi:hypothetical protein